MKFAACLIAATSVGAFVPQQRNGVVKLTLNNNEDDGQGTINIFDMVDDYWNGIWRDRNQNNNFNSMFGGVIPDAKLPSVSPNLIDGILNKQRSNSPSIESVGDFDIDLANEIEAALAMAEKNDVYNSREQQAPLSSNPNLSIASRNNEVESATAAATKAWLDNITSCGTSLKDKQIKAGNQMPFFPDDRGQYAGNNNSKNYVGDSPFHRKSEENWSTDSEFDQCSGLEKKSIEETYKMYKQYFEQGIETSDGMRSPSQDDVGGDDDYNKVFISDSAFALAESLRLDPYEIYQYKRTKLGSTGIIEELDVRNYLDWRYEILLSNENLAKNKQKPDSNKRGSREVDNLVYEERDRARRQRTRANKSADFGSRKNDSEKEYYDSYRQMAEPISRNAQDDPIQYSEPEQQIPQNMNNNFQPQKPRQSHLSKLVFGAKNANVENRSMNPANNAPLRQTDSIRRDQQGYERPSRPLGTNKNYPQDRSYRDTRNKNSIDIVSNSNEEQLTYEYNAYFSSVQRPNQTHHTSAQQAGSLKGLLENRLDQNLHKQEQQRYFDERLLRASCSRLNRVQDQQMELDKHLQQSRHRRDLQQQQQDLDDRLDQKIQQLSETTQKVTRDAKRAIEDWFPKRDKT